MNEPINIEGDYVVTYSPVDNPDIVYTFTATSDGPNYVKGPFTLVYAERDMAYLDEVTLKWVDIDKVKYEWVDIPITEDFIKRWEDIGDDFKEPNKG
jgi:predicted GH43/DUF377 family glycosyl hydrolase